MICIALLALFFGRYSESAPTIDISPWIRNVDTQSEEWLSTAQKVDDALITFGLFLAIGHDINDKIYSSAINSAYNLFSSDSKKLGDVEVNGGGFVRGYIGFGKESGLEHFFEPKEGYSFGYNWESDSEFVNRLQGFNVWPEEMQTSTIDTMNNMFSHSSIIAEAIINNLSIYYEMLTKSPLGIVVEGGDTISVMRLFHYFSLQSDVVSNKDTQNSEKIPIGSSPHTDWGLLTVILQEEGTLGLQAKVEGREGREGRWEDVPPVKGSVVINGGDFLQLASKGRYHSPVHRVLSPSDDKDRISYVYFYYPSYDTRLDIDSVCVGTDAGEAHNTLTRSIASVAAKKDDDSGKSYVIFGDYIMRKWEEVFRGGSSKA